MTLESVLVYPPRWGGLVMRFYCYASSFIFKQLVYFSLLFVHVILPRTYSLMCIICSPRFSFYPTTLSVFLSLAYSVAQSLPQMTWFGIHCPSKSRSSRRNRSLPAKQTYSRAPAVWLDTSAGQPAFIKVLAWGFFSQTQEASHFFTACVMLIVFIFASVPGIFAMAVVSMSLIQESDIVACLIPGASFVLDKRRVTHNSLLWWWSVIIMQAVNTD